ncbi:MAG TPA: Uma2 family endonuclease [Vicinamibacteria bacterium]|nr:Uma2 family endonuclease [Vicinamibacteria bacterium]
MILLDRQRRLSVGDYHRMIGAGILDEDDRIELLEGVIVEMAPQGPKHARLIQRLCDPTFARVPPDRIARCQLPLTLGRDSEPEPDVSLVRRADAASNTSHPTTADLVFEVADDSLPKDRLTKAALYAGAGIPEYVIVNVVEECLEVHRDPDPGSRRYRTLVTLAGDQVFESAAVPGFGFRLASLFE